MIRLSVLGTLFAGLSWFAVLKDYQKRRILTFIDPESDIQGAGWNAFQSMIAVGSGQLWGKGHGGGTQTQLSFLPEQHTDFAFSVWAEEMGLMGCALLLLLYLLLLIVSLAIAADARDTYGSLVAVGVAVLILWQTLINVGMVIGGAGGWINASAFFVWRLESFDHHVWFGSASQRSLSASGLLAKRRKTKKADQRSLSLRCLWWRSAGMLRQRFVKLSFGNKPYHLLNHFAALENQDGWDWPSLRSS